MGKVLRYLIIADTQIAPYHVTAVLRKRWLGLSLHRTRTVHTAGGNPPGDSPALHTPLGVPRWVYPSWRRTRSPPAVQYSPLHVTPRAAHATICTPPGAAPAFRMLLSVPLLGAATATCTAPRMSLTVQLLALHPRCARC